MAAQDNNLIRKNSSVDVTDEREAHSKFWIAAYTRPRCEKKASGDLEKQGIETYVPIQKQLRFWSDRKKYVEIPVIPMILFARVKKDEVLNIKRHSLILRVLSYPGNQCEATIPDKEIEDLRRILAQSEIPVKFEFESFNTNDKVVITKGKLKGIEGKIKCVDNDATTLWVSVSILGGTIIRMNHSDLERVYNKTT